nr:(2Fe-2S)-binding protein [Ferrimonas marina]
MTLNINGTERSVDAAEDIPLLWLLRDELQLTGTKYGCGIAQCGACTVLIDGKASRACMVRAKSAQGKTITTIEANQSAEGQAVTAVWDATNVHQCGYCQSGQVMAATALLMKNPNPDDKAIDQAMSGVICRCGTYERVRRGIKQAAEQLKRNAQAAPGGSHDV